MMNEQVHDKIANTGIGSAMATDAPLPLDPDNPTRPSEGDVSVKSFLGLTTTSELEKAIYQAEKKAIRRITDKLQAWHNKYEMDQEKMEESFSYNDIDSIKVNFWDDFHSDGHVPKGEVTTTFATIKDRRIPDAECHTLLKSLLEHIQDNGLLPPTVKLKMHLVDSAAEYPILISEHEYLLTKTWQIKITNITHSQLDDLMVKLENYSNGIPFNIISSS
jgi:hypothetical protein